MEGRSLLIASILVAPTGRIWINEQSAVCKKGRVPISDLYHCWIG